MKSKLRAYTYHELIKLLIITDHAVTQAGVLSHHILRLSQLGVDPGELVDRRGDPEARHVGREKRLVERVS